MAVISVTVLARSNLIYKPGKATALEHHWAGDARVKAIEVDGDVVRVLFEDGRCEALPASAVSVLYDKQSADERYGKGASNAVDTQGQEDIQEAAEREPEAEADVRESGKGKGGSSNSSGSRKKRRKKGAAGKGAGK